jgi:hypothetical protein
VKSLLLALLPLVLGAAAPQDANKPLDPAGLIAAVESRSTGHGIEGRWEMRVASTGKGRYATFLNSKEDFRAPGNVSFALSPAVAEILAKRLGAPPQEALKGKHVVVDGVAYRVGVYNAVSGRPHSFNRIAYEVRVEQASHILAID